MCFSLMDKLNPSNDWIKFKNDDADHEDDEDFWDPERKAQKLY